jgi:hypothetical protein
MRDLLLIPVIERPGSIRKSAISNAAPLRVRRTGKHTPGVATVQVIAQLAVADRVMLLTIASSR